MTSFQLPDSVVQVLASRGHRHRHLLWHLTREYWTRFSSADQKRFLERFPHWVPRNPSRGPDGSIITGNGSGFDFLGMHHNMITMVDLMLIEVRAPRIRAWDRFPGNDEVSVPIITGADEDAVKCKSTWFWHKLNEESQQLRDPQVLAKLSLDELGTRIENGIHNAMHLRFGEYPKDGLRVRDLRLSDPVDTRFDDPAYQTLLDMYSAHVHPLFWKIHAWIDDCVVHWQAAHGDIRIDWTKAWEGPMHHHMDGAVHGVTFDPRAQVDSAEAALKQLVPAIKGISETISNTFPVVLP